VTDRIRAKYFLDPAIKARRIEVETRDGVVTVRGEVASDTERAQALLLARTIEGATRVEDGLSVNPALAAVSSGAVLPRSADPMPVPAEDEALTGRVQALFHADTSLAPLQVTAKDGVLLIEGTVATPADKQRAVDVARRTEGVIEVVDRIDVGQKSKVKG
jgi:hyperosmotically inducible protein